MGAIAPPPKGCKKRKKERKEVIFYCFCAVFEASSGDRPPKGFCRAGKLPQLAPRIHGTSSTTPPSKSGGKTPATTPRLEFTEPHRLPPPSKSGRKTPPITPLEFTEPHRLPPLRNLAGKLHQLPPSNSRNLIDYPPPPRNLDGKLQQLPPASNSRNLIDYPPRRNLAGKLHQLPPPRIHGTSSTTPPLEIGRNGNSPPPPNSIPRSA